MSQQDPVVGITMGSDSDLPVMGAAADVLEAFGVPHEVRVVSAHRTPRCWPTTAPPLPSAG